MFENKGGAQTSFIPKRPMPGANMPKVKTPGSVNIALIISVIIFIGSILAAGAAYYFRAAVQKDIETMKLSISDRENSLDQALIDSMIERDRVLSAVEKILNSHVSVSKIFEAIGKVTTRPVRFNSLTLERMEGNVMNIKLTGVAESFSALAFQEQVFAQQLSDKNAKVKLTSPVISQFSINRGGAINFGMDMSVPIDQILYVNDYPRSTSSTNTPVENQEVIPETQIPPAENRSLDGLNNFLR